MQFETKIGRSTREQLHVHGYNLADDLIGNITLADMLFLGVKHRKPTEAESKMLNATLIAICEHGFTPSSLSSRLTYLGAPEAIQAAVAAGLLGAGSVYFGAMEYVAEMLQKTYQKHGNEYSTEELAGLVIQERKEQGLQLPGFGHHIHKPVDPRTPKLFAIAEELGFLNKHSQLLIEMHKQFCEQKGKEITLNVTGAIGAILSDMEIDYRLVKSFAVAARAVGLVGHIAEEIETGRTESVAQQVFEYVENHTDYKG
ncbi:citryl-CoA lyase [Mesobacillus maritimus]|uniref:citrate synthase (unknown stereospecificity) n=1 Tax=Mesobacillus maritimus TaxID=1643336 RepID=A0ABS7K0E7_9BACI|nr:citryl-CoA lyase [Mesobacillus maritimus]MBY0095696.1 citryl-CoA lyase [Mesobacillus maritimus]